MITGDQVLIKQINKSLVMNIIREKRNISRAQISKITGLNRATVSAIVDELIYEGIVIEEGLGESKGGRKPIILRINENYGCIIGIDLGVNYVSVLLANFNAKTLWSKKLMLNIGESQEEIIDKIFTLVDEALINAPKTIKGILGIGMGVPGITNHKEGIILKAPNLNWENVNIKEIIREKYDTKIFIDNEANVAAIGEKWFGTGQKFKNLIYVSAGIGVGAGIIINDKLFRGANGLAGELGHMTIDVNGIKCSCGNIGCWELYASEKALIRLMSPQNDINYSKNKKLIDIIEQARNGSIEAINSFKSVAKFLGLGIVNLINTFDPELIIIGNTISLAYDLIIDEVKRIVNDNCFTAKHSKVKIEVSRFGTDACAIGAIALVISDIFSLSF